MIVILFMLRISMGIIIRTWDDGFVPWLLPGPSGLNLVQYMRAVNIGLLVLVSIETVFLWHQQSRNRTWLLVSFLLCIQIFAGMLFAFFRLETVAQIHAAACPSFHDDVSYTNEYREEINIPAYDNVIPNTDFDTIDTPFVPDFPRPLIVKLGAKTVAVNNKIFMYSIQELMEEPNNRELRALWELTRNEHSMQKFSPNQHHRSGEQAEPRVDFYIDEAVPYGVVWFVQRALETNGFRNARVALGFSHCKDILLPLPSQATDEKSMYRSFSARLNGMTPSTPHIRFHLNAKEEVFASGAFSEFSPFKTTLTSIAGRLQKITTFHHRDYPDAVDLAIYHIADDVPITNVVRLLLATYKSLDDGYYPFHSRIMIQPPAKAN